MHTHAGLWLCNLASLVSIAKAESTFPLNLSIAVKQYHSQSSSLKPYTLVVSEFLRVGNQEVANLILPRAVSPGCSKKGQWGLRPPQAWPGRTCSHTLSLRSSAQGSLVLWKLAPHRGVTPEGEERQKQAVCAGKTLHFYKLVSQKWCPIISEVLCDLASSVHTHKMTGGVDTGSRVQDVCLPRCLTSQVPLPSSPGSLPLLSSHLIRFLSIYTWSGYFLPRGPILPHPPFCGFKEEYLGPPWWSSG